MKNVRHFYFNDFRECCHVAWKDSGNAVIVDPGAATEEERRELKDFISESGLRPLAILLTHGHFDHIYATVHLQEFYGIPVYMNSRDEAVLEQARKFAPQFGMPVPDCSFRHEQAVEGAPLAIGDFSFEVIETPGHTPGCVCYLNREDGYVFTGDTLFAGAIGRTDLELSDYDSEIISIMEKLMMLDSDIVVYPGHGRFSDIGTERMTNPFLEPFNEKEEECSDEQ